MKAVRLHHYNEPLRVDDIDEPSPQPGEFIVEIAFAGVNPLDIWLTHGDVQPGKQALPFVLGSDGSGYVGDRRVLIHERGLGVVRDGLYRQRASVPADALVDIPPSVNLETAAALGVPGSTAWMLTHETAPVTAEDRVVVLGCAGAVGILLLQLALRAGATVTGQTASTTKANLVRSALGCEVITADASGLTKVITTLEPTIVFDPLGDAYTGAVIAGLGSGATIALFGTSAGTTGTLDLRRLYKAGVTIRGYAAPTHPPETIRRALHGIIDEAAAGHLKAIVDRVLPLGEAQAAHRLLLAKKVTGKVLLAV